MTAPGNSALLFILTAVFVACAGYAAGRLHQRFQMEQDREEAYRDGYDMATRSIFSTAARLIAPRRSARAGAGRAVLDGSVVSDGSALPAVPASADSPAAFLPPAAPASPLSPVASPASSSFPASLPAPPSFPASSPVSSSFPASLPVSSPFPESSPVSSPFSAASPVASSFAGATPGSVSADEGLASGSPSTAERDAASLGFPVPPRPPSRVVGEPASPGGVVYRPFPDPRFVGGAEPLPADRGSLHIPYPSRPVSEPADPGSASSGAGLVAPGSAVAGSVVGGSGAGGAAREARTGAEPGPSGKHTVPDELVQAATYRLPADRVFRAKVPDATNAPGLPEEPTTRLSVPKPRQS